MAAAEPGQVKPRDVRTAPLFLCASNPRRSETILTSACSACGWWSAVGEPGETLDLFSSSEHTDAECHRRQTDPRFRFEQDNARLTSAGLPGLLVAPPETRSGSGN